MRMVFSIIFFKKDTIVMTLNFYFFLVYFDFKIHDLKNDIFFLNLWRIKLIILMVRTSFKIIKKLYLF